VVSTEPFSHGTDTAVPVGGNGDLQTLICVLAVASHGNSWRGGYVWLLVFVVSEVSSCYDIM